MSPEALRLPDFIIVGAMKAGTTSVAHYLDEHPDIYVPRQEVHFFDHKALWSKGSPAYASYFRDHRGAACVGEKTPSYSYRPSLKPPIPERIRSLVPHVRLIWCLRNPVERAYSHWWHGVTHGYETRSFEIALRDEGVNHGRATQAYRHRGVYVTQIQHFLRSFLQERMLFILTEHLQSDPRATLTNAYGFLGVDSHFVGRRIAEKKNVAHRLVGPVGAQHLISANLRRLPLRVWRGFERVLGTPRPPLPEPIQQQLAEYYRPYNAALAELTGLDLSGWENESDWGRY